MTRFQGGALDGVFGESARSRGSRDGERVSKWRTDRQSPRFILALLVVGLLMSSSVSYAEGSRQKPPPNISGVGLLERALKGQARIVDLTQPIDTNTPTYDGGRAEFRYEALASMEKEGYAAGAFRMPEHFGTHVDAPGHFIKGGKTIDRIEPGRLIVRAVVIDVRKECSSNPDYELNVNDIAAWERGGAIPDGAAVLLLTGWDGRYGDPERYRNADATGVMHFPGYSPAAIEYLTRKRRVVALGIDTLSIDYGPSKDFRGHQIALAAGLYHMENLTNLDTLPARGAVIFVGPLPIVGGSGSPARVLAIAP
jgi:kynurenine formamidase